MALSKKWINVVRRKLHRSSHPDNVHPHSKSVSFEEETAALPAPLPSVKKDLTKRDVAAVKIQAFLRGYLVRRAFRALTGPRTERLGKSENCFKVVQRKLRKSSHNKKRESISIEEVNVSQEISSYEEPSGTVALTPSSPETETIREDSAAISQTFQTDDSISTSSKKKRRGKSMNCFDVLRRRSHREILYPNGNTPSNSTEEVAKEESIDIEDPIKTASSKTSSAKNEETIEETACYVDVNAEVSSTLSPEKKEDAAEEDTAARSDERNEEPTKETVNFANANGAVSSTGPSEDPRVTASSSPPKTEMTSEDSAAASETLRTGDSIATSSKNKRSGKSTSCFNVIRRRSHREILHPKGNTPSNFTGEALAEEESIDIEDPVKTASSTISSAKNEETTEETACYVDVNAEVSPTLSSEKKDSTKEDTAARSNERDEDLAKETVNFANANGAASSPKTEITKEDSAAVSETCRTDDSIPTSSKKKRRGKSTNCFNVIRRRSHREILYPNGNTPSNSAEEEITKEETSSAKNEEKTEETPSFVDVNGEASSTLSSERKDSTKEDPAARIDERNEELPKEAANFADANGAASSTVPSEGPSFTASLSSPKTELTREDSAALREKKSSKKKRTGTPQNCFNALRRRSHRAVLSPNGDILRNSTEEAIAEEERIGIQGPSETASSTTSSGTPEESTEEPANLVNVNGEGSSTLSSEKITAGVSETFRAGDSISTSSEKKRMGKPQKRFNGLLRRRSRRSVLSPDGSIPSRSSEEAIAEEERNDTEDPIETKEETAKLVNDYGEASSEKKELTKEDTAARSNPKDEELTKERVDSANTDVVASSTVPSEKKHSTKEDTAAIKIQAIFRGHLVRRTPRARESTATSSKKKRKETPKNCFGRRFRRRSPKATISPRSNASRSSSTEEPLVKEEPIKVKDAYGPASSTPSSQPEELTKHVAATKIQAFFRGHRARRAFRSLKGLMSSSRRNENRRRTPRGSRRWFDAVRRKFRKKPHRDIMIPVTNPCARISTDEALATEETTDFGSADDAIPSTPPSAKLGYLSREDAAAIKIQAVFRGHLARRAYAALKGLVKLQAVVRGASVRRQARIAENCMHALARLQVRVRARQLLNGE